MLVMAPAVPKPFRVIAKPAGAVCNLACKYCFYLSKKTLYPASRFRMSEAVLDAYLRQVICPEQGQTVSILWQGGEPTLMGLDFYRRAVVLAERYCRPGQRVEHALQTNGTLLTKEWRRFLRAKDFLVGLSVDGPREMHDAYRRDKQGNGTFDRVMRGMEHLQSADLRFNVLCTVNAANVEHPVDVYRFFRDDCGARFIQFIPIVARPEGTSCGSGSSAGQISAEQWGRFLISVFDEWLRRDVGRVFVQTFEAALASWMAAGAPLCVFAEVCGRAIALEHNGDVYSCDHFVDPGHFLGNLADRTLVEMVSSDQQVSFGDAKRTGLPEECLRCDVLFACNGECPKNRFVPAPDQEAGVNYLCRGYKAFFHHIDGPMRLMAALVRDGRQAAEIMSIFAAARRNERCPCGSGRKAKLCHAG